MIQLEFKGENKLAAIPELFFCDVDRTLLTHDHVLLPAVAKAALSLANVDIPLVLASARSPKGLEPVHKSVGASDVACCFNGAWVGRVSTRETLKETRLDRQFALHAMSAIHEMGGSPIWFDLGCCFVLETDEAIARRRTDVTGDPLELISAPDEAPGAPFKLLATFPTDIVESAVNSLSNSLGGDANVAQSGPALVEIVGRGVRKDLATAHVARHFGVDADRTIAAGDSDNDLEMLQWAGFAISLGNAKPHIRASADLVAPSCDEGGLADAMNWLVQQSKKG